MASIGLILRHTFVHSFSYCRIQGVPAATKRAQKSVSEYQLNQCNAEKNASITHPEAPHYGIICTKC